MTQPNTMTQTVLLAVRQADELDRIIPEAYMLRGLRADADGQKLLGWLDSAPDLPAEVMAPLAHATADSLSTRFGADRAFWLEYLNQRALRQANLNAEPVVIGEAETSGTGEAAPVEAFAPDAAPSVPPAAAPLIPQRALIARAEQLTQQRRAACPDESAPQLAALLRDLGVTVKATAISSLRTGWFTRRIDAGQSVEMSFAKAEAVVTGLELLLTEPPSPPVASPVTVPEPIRAEVKPEVRTRPAPARRSAPPVTDKERRAFVRELLETGNGAFRMADFRRGTGISAGAAMNLLNSYDFVKHAGNGVYKERA